MKALDEFNENMPWDFSDEWLVRELHRAINLARKFAVRADVAEGQVARMRKQHRAFIEHFGEPL